MKQPSKKKLLRRIRELEQQITTDHFAARAHCRRVAEQVLVVAAKPLPAGCDRLCTPVLIPFGDGACWTAEITPPDGLHWIGPDGSLSWELAL